MSKKESLPTIEVPQFPGEVFDDSGRLEMNPMVTFEVGEHNEAALHISEAYDESGQKSDLGEKLRLLHEGFKKFAHLLQTNEKFSHIDKITAISWIVVEHPKLVERFGFTIDNSIDDYESRRWEYKKRTGSIKASKILKKPGFAYMTRDKFLELYGEK